MYYIYCVYPVNSTTNVKWLTSRDSLTKHKPGRSALEHAHSDLDAISFSGSCTHLTSRECTRAVYTHININITYAYARTYTYVYTLQYRCAEHEVSSTKREYSLHVMNFRCVKLLIYRINLANSVAEHARRYVYINEHARKHGSTNDHQITYTEITFCT